MRLTLPSKPKLVLYAVGTVIGIAAVSWFFSERQAPELTSFELSSNQVSISQDQVFSFTGSMRDERGITEAQLECVDNGEMRFIIFLAIQGNDRNRVSFGRIEGSANWTGRWGGNAYDLQFEGLAPLTETFEPANCSWFARVKDIVGNEAYYNTGVKLAVTE